jgi:hypothetical protein
MTGSLRQRAAPGILDTGRDVVFFALFYLYLLFIVDSRLLYFGSVVIENVPVFFRGWNFFVETVYRPGGLVIYISSFLNELFYYSWTGALVIMAIALGLFATTRALIGKTGAARLRGLSYVMPILVIILYTRYANYNYICIITAVLSALASAYIYLRLRCESALKNSAIFLIISVLLYTAAASAYFIFAVICVIYEIFFAGRQLNGIVYLAAALLIAYTVGVLFFDLSPGEAFSSLMPYNRKITVNFAQLYTGMTGVIFLLCIFTPATMLLLGVIRGRILSKIFAVDSGKTTGKWVLLTVILFLITGGAVIFSYDKRLRYLLAVNYYNYTRQWSKLLDASAGCPKSLYVMHAVNRALYHTGKLSTDMFKYLQSPHAMYFEGKFNNQFSKWVRANTNIDLGALNLAEIDLTECLELSGRQPILLKELAYIKMAKGDLSSAKVYLNALDKTLFFSGQAKKYLAEIEADPNLTGDKEIQELRQNVPVADYAYFDSYYYNEMLERVLLNANKHNKMAFEYLMAWCLLYGQTDKIADNIRRLADFDYKGIPRLYEEALLIYKARGGKQHDWKISSESTKRFNDFTSIRKKHGPDKQGAYNELLKTYGDSYFFYYTFLILSAVK